MACGFGAANLPRHYLFLKVQRVHTFGVLSEVQRRLKASLGGQTPWIADWFEKVFKSMSDSNGSTDKNTTFVAPFHARLKVMLLRFEITKVFRQQPVSS